MKLNTIDVGGVTYAEVKDGSPVYTHSDGKYVPFDVPSAVSKITALNAETKGHREAKETAEARANAFEGIQAPEKARAGLVTVHCWGPQAIDDLLQIDSGMSVERLLQPLECLDRLERRGSLTPRAQPAFERPQLLRGTR